MTPTFVIPDLLAPVHGFRDWRLTDEGLCSPHTGIVWTEKTAEASCSPRTVEDFVLPAHAAPSASCNCGIHAYYEPHLDWSRTDYRGVTGIVTLWGRLEVHANGMRAEHAQIAALGVYHRWTRRQRQAVLAAARDLDVDVLHLDDLAEAAELYASPMPAQLLPGAPKRRRVWPARRPQPAPAHELLVGA